MREIDGFRGSGFGEVFVALDKTSNDLVAIKKMKMASDTSVIENESRLLQECNSKYIVRYYDVIRKDNEVWVRVVGCVSGNRL